MKPKSGKIDPALLERFGYVCVRWAVVEAHEGALLTFVLGASRAHMHIVTQNVSGATITDWLRILCDIRFTHEASRKALKELLRIIDETRSERNALVHGIWHPGPIPQTALVNSLRLDRRELMKDELVTIADLDELIHRIDTIVAELTTIGKNLGILE